MPISVKRATGTMFTPSGDLYRIDQISEHFHELFIVSGYRHPRSSVRQCLGSIFKLTNETVNIWTHLIPAVYFFWLVIRDSWEFNLLNDPYGHPYLVYMVTMCIYPAASCTAHIFNTMSEKARHICFFMDYWALSVYSLGGAIAYRAYSFPVNLSQSWFKDWFVPIAIFNSLMSCIMSCDTRFLPHGLQKKIFRISAFAVPYFFDVIPTTYRAFFGDASEWDIGGLYYHMHQFIFAFLSAFLYTSHIPERFFPGKFDLFGHSHQFFHVVSALGTYDQLTGMRLDMINRKQVLETHGLFSEESFPWSIPLMITVALANVLIVVLFSRRLHDVVVKGSPSQSNLLALVDSLKNGRGQTPTKSYSSEKGYANGNANHNGSTYHGQRKRDLKVE